MTRSWIAKHYPHALLLASATACLVIVLTAPDRGTASNYAWPKQKEATTGPFDTHSKMRSSDSTRTLAEVLRQARARLDRLQRKQAQEQPPEIQQAAAPLDDDPQPHLGNKPTGQVRLPAIKPRYRTPHETYAVVPDPLAWRRPEALAERRYPLLEYGEVGEEQTPTTTPATDPLTDSLTDASTPPPSTVFPTDAGDADTARAEDTPALAVASEHTPAPPAPPAPSASRQTAIPVIASTPPDAPVVMTTPPTRATPTTPLSRHNATPTPAATPTAQDTVPVKPVKQTVTDRRTVSTGHTTPVAAPIDDDAQDLRIRKIPEAAPDTSHTTAEKPDNNRDRPGLVKPATPANPIAAQPTAPDRPPLTPAHVTPAVKLPEQVAKLPERAVKQPEQSAKPHEQVVNPPQRVVKPSEQAVKPHEQVAKLPERATVPGDDAHLDDDKPEQTRSRKETPLTRVPAPINTPATRTKPAQPTSGNTQPLVVLIDNPDSIGSDRLNVIDKAIKKINRAVKKADIDIELKMTTDRNTDYNILFREDDGKDMGNKLGLAQFAVTEDEAGNESFLGENDRAFGGKAKITLNNAFDWFAGEDENKIGDNQFDYQTTLTHEILHAVGLDDDSDNRDAVSYGLLSPGEVRRDLDIDEIDGLAELYESNNPWRSLSDDTDRFDKKHRGKIRYKSRALTAAVPEPASLSLIVLGLLGISWRRRN